MTTKPTFADVQAEELTQITGGGTRGAGGDDSKLQLMLTSITDSIKEVANGKNNSGNDMMPMMMMMMMMGGGGGSSATVAAAPPPPPQQPGTVIKVNVRR
jgi:hypothetical protein